MFVAYMVFVFIIPKMLLNFAVSHMYKSMVIDVLYQDLLAS